MMKNTFGKTGFVLGLLMISTLAFSQDKAAEKKIKKTITEFIEAVDKSDVEGLKITLHDSYRAVINDQSKGTLSPVDKTTYLALLEKGTIGGVKRNIAFESVDVEYGITANVRVKMQRPGLDFYSYYSLAKVNSEWQLVQELVYVDVKTK
jgi:hypothetical protein